MHVIFYKTVQVNCTLCCSLLYLPIAHLILANQTAEHLYSTINNPAIEPFGGQPRPAKGLKTFVACFHQYLLLRKLRFFGKQNTTLVWFINVKLSYDNLSME